MTAPDGMEGPGILVARLSESFADLWPELGEGLGVPVWLVAANELEVISRDAAAVVLACGGAEGEALEWLEGREVPPGSPVLAVGADPGRRMAVQLVTRGSADYFVLPEDLELLRNAVEAAVARARDARRREAWVPSDREVEAFGAMVGESPALRAVLRRAARLLPHAGATALLLGETGTGKELLARAIHEGGPRRAAPFVPVNCSALPSHLIESELFGHEKGAFTDAHASKPGLFEVAHGGTLFLDEIGTLPVELQAKLLRVLEDRQVRRVGSTKVRTVDVRIIAATNDELGQAVRRGTFRQDLYFRLSVVTLELPPLRERGHDVLHIADALLPRLTRQYELPAVTLGADARRALLGYSWPGNVRELKNAIERAVLLSPPGQLDMQELVPPAEGPPAGGALPFPAALDDIAVAAARTMLDWCDGNRSEAARRLQISRRRLRRLLNGEGGDGDDAGAN